MTRFGYAIRVGGDPQISGALAAGIRAGTQGPHPSAATPLPPVKVGKTSEALRRVAMHQHTPEEWAAMTEEARCEYGLRRPPLRLSRGFWAAVGLVVYLLAEAYHAQDRVLEQDGTSNSARERIRGRAS